MWFTRDHGRLAPTLNNAPHHPGGVVQSLQQTAKSTGESIDALRGYWLAVYGSIVEPAKDEDPDPADVGVSKARVGIDWKDLESASRADEAYATRRRDALGQLAQELIDEADVMDGEWSVLLPETNCNGIRVRLMTTQLRDTAQALLMLKATSEHLIPALRNG